eukprot:GHVP01038045.1.p1 GENE.GHVP01038045.1~~GHVP01038045.1.p1  ORF type:complete len:313 (-),score=75.80 GHVP01038045.1:1531-2469(-)
MELDSRRFMEEAGINVEAVDFEDEDEIDALTRLHTRKKRLKNSESLAALGIGELRSNQKDRFHVWSVKTSNDSRLWAAATSHGVFVYRMDLVSNIKRKQNGSNIGTIMNSNFTNLGNQRFLSENINISSLVENLQSKKFAQALIIALCLNDPAILSNVIALTPPDQISLSVETVPPEILGNLLNFFKNCMSYSFSLNKPKKSQNSPPRTIKKASQDNIQTGRPMIVHLGLCVSWVSCILTTHTPLLQEVSEGKSDGPSSEQSVLLGSRTDVRSVLLMLLREMQISRKNVAEVQEKNIQILRYLVMHAESISV